VMQKVGNAIVSVTSLETSVMDVPQDIIISLLVMNVIVMKKDHPVSFVTLKLVNVLAKMT